MEQQNSKPLLLLQEHEVMDLSKDSTEVDITKTILLNEYVLFLTAQKRSRNTIKSYTFQIDKMLKDVDEDSPSLTVNQIVKFLNGKTVNSHAAVISFLDFVEFYIKKKFYYIKFPDIYRGEQKVIEVITEEDIDKVIQFMPDNYKFFTKFLYMGGLRVSEPFRLKVDCINWDKAREDKTKYALLKLSKTKGKRERLVPLNPTFTQELFEFLKAGDRLMPDNYIFDFKTERYFKRRERKAKIMQVGTMMDLNEKELGRYRAEWAEHRYIGNKTIVFARLFREACIKALGKPYSPHTLRKSRATLLLRKGIPIIGVRDFLGHKSIKTTEFYVTLSTDELAEKMDNLKL